MLTEEMRSILSGSDHSCMCFTYELHASENHIPVAVGASAVKRSALEGDPIQGSDGK